MQWLQQLLFGKVQIVNEKDILVPKRVLSDDKSRYIPGWVVYKHTFSGLGSLFVEKTSKCHNIDIHIVSPVNFEHFKTHGKFPSEVYPTNRYQKTIVEKHDYREISTYIDKLSYVIGQGERCIVLVNTNIDEDVRVDLSVIFGS